MEQARNHDWDALVIGAGPAGAIAARQLAIGGAKVLLVDKAKFPRRKVCGCYLNQSGLGSLAAIGLGGLAERLGSPTVQAIRIGIKGRVARLPLPGGAAISRDVLDTVLAQEAIGAGVDLLAGVAAKVGRVDGSRRHFELRLGNLSVAGRCKAIVVADGIGGQSLKDCDDIQFETSPSSLIGMSSMSDHLPADYQPGTIHMAVGRDGYVGALQLQDGMLDVAAAFQPAALKRSSPGELAQQTMNESGLPATVGLDQLRWLGTPPLSKRATSPAAERLFLVGDSAGYVEPFTGEGMSWAMSSGRAVVPFVLKTILNTAVDGASDAPALWTQEQRRLLNHRKRACHWLTRALRHPPLVSAGVFTLARMPILASPVVQWMNRTPQPTGC